MLWLDPELFLAQGLVPVLISASFEPLIGDQRQFTFSSAGEGEENVLVGQCGLEGDIARLRFLFPDNKPDDPGFLLLVETLLHGAGKGGARVVMAEIGLDRGFQALLRRCGFTPVGWRHLWRLTRAQQPDEDSPCRWQTPASEDVPALQSLYRRLVPPAFQPVFPPPGERLPSLALRMQGRLCGYADLRQGGQALIITPLIDPECGSPEAVLDALFCQAAAGGRQVFLSVPSCMQWIESGLQHRAVLALPQRAILARHLALRLPVEETAREAAAQRRPRPAHPITRAVRGKPSI